MLLRLTKENLQNLYLHTLYARTHTNTYTDILRLGRRIGMAKQTVSNLVSFAATHSIGHTADDNLALGPHRKKLRAMKSPHSTIILDIAYALHV